MSNLKKIQYHLDELATLLLEADSPDIEWMLPSFDFEYTMRDYANLSIALMSILSVEYTKKLWEVSNGKVDPNEYAKSEDIQERVKSLEAPFLYHLWMTNKEIVDKAFFDK